MNICLLSTALCEKKVQENVPSLNEDFLKKKIVSWDKKRKAFSDMILLECLKHFAKQIIWFLSQT